MSLLDWVVLIGTLLFIVAYGIYRTRGQQDIDSYLKGGYSFKWWTVGLSVMATQASAITFLSVPGEAFESGMGFVQFYLGLPIAMIVLSVTFIPIYYRLKVYTAYEFLESRFDLKTRILAAFLFLVQRGLAAGLTIFAPSIILSAILGWSLSATTLLIGVVVTIYTVSGGTKAVSQTQKQQMVVMLGGMIAAVFVVLNLLPQEVSFGRAVDIAGYMGKLNVINLEFSLSDRYNIWSGIAGGFFLQLAYFGTDQSQVQRYLTGKSITQSRLALVMNGLLKVPMQFLILMVGILVFVFYQFYQPPLFFIEKGKESVTQSEYAGQWEQLDQQYQQVFEEKRENIQALLSQIEQDDEAAVAGTRQRILALEEETQTLKAQAREMVAQANPDNETEDADYVFLTFVMRYFPQGMVGLLLAVIFSAAMSSTASELNALGTTTTIDFYRRTIRPNASDEHYLRMSRWFILGWGIIAMIFASLAPLADNLIEFVNLVGSLFYGTILGIFLTAFYIRHIRSRATFWAALVAEGMVLLLFLFFRDQIGYLWYNFIGCALMVITGLLFQAILPRATSS
ncbi:sodium:solute symporter family transporter [Tunicatimonas pelagia]|uniref:sodium:solute symporter family transporter n=1 Tax=Tunicatimonas pelagia TaxID=931531 RepID=UPI00266567C2|nr:sodium:solute symporter [Tunicatimonas pelagia]WKN44647.1 sodium:solute symporter [Tunicatimonas pelagia]